jgi:hypothetical protein
MSSIEWYTQISRQAQTQLSIDENVNFYHRENFEKMISFKNIRFYFVVMK